MMRAYSGDLRKRVVRAVIDDGMSASAAARRFGIGRSTAILWVQRYRREGTLAPGPIGRPRGMKVAPYQDFIMEKMKDTDTTLDILQAALWDEYGVYASRTLLHRFIRDEGLTYKKTVHASEQERPDVALARWLWRRALPELEASQLVFIDETWFRTDMTPLRGWAMRGERLMAKAPGGHWKTTTLVAGLTTDGVIAPVVLDGPMNGDAFIAWIEQFLAPALQPGQIVIMDNLPAHKIAAVAGAIEAVEAELLYLPPYSPDLNPIEMSFAQIKAKVRRGNRRTVADLWDEIGAAVQIVTPQHAKNYFNHIGYRSDVL